MRTTALAPLLLAFAHGGCAEPRQLYTEPAAVDVRPSPTSSPGARVAQRLELGGMAFDVAVLDGEVLAANPTGIDVFDVPGEPARERIEIPGHPRDLALDGDALWVAAGRGGIVRIRHPLDPARREVTTWPVGGYVDGVVPAHGQLWAADDQGRVLVLPAEAGADASPRTLALDGKPSRLAPWRNGVVVACEYGGLRAVEAGSDGAPREVPAPAHHPYASAVAASGDDLFVSTYFELVHHTADDVALLQHSHATWQLAMDGDQVLVPARGEGVLAWDGIDDALVQWRFGFPGTDAPVEPYSLAIADAGRAVLAAGRPGVVWADRTTSPWQVVDWSPYAGLFRALEPLAGGGVAALLSDDARASTLVVLRPDDDGALHAESRLEIPAKLEAAAVVGERVLLAGDGAFEVDLALPPERRAAVPITLGDEPINALAALPSGRVAALVGTAAVHWFERSPGGAWIALAKTEVDQEWMPVGLDALGPAVGVGYAGYGRMKLLQVPGAPPSEIHLVAGELSFNDGAPVRPSGLAWDGTTAWAAIPYLGVEGVRLEDGRHTLLRAAPGGWDVAPWGDLLAVAAGSDGVTLLDPNRPDDPVVSRYALPGETWFVLPRGRRLLAASGGTLFVLDPPPDLP